jgi:hypothetical protein
MEEYDLMEQSLLKNLQEFVEFVVYDLKITNYYDLVDYIVDLHNFKAKAYKKNKELTLEIIKEIEMESEE